MNESQQIATSTFLDQLARQLETSANAKAVFGPPVEHNGTTVIPVAKARWGLGGGSGSRPGDQQNKLVGTGGGGGAAVIPVGFIELTGDRVRFRRIRSAALLPALTVFGGLIALTALQTVVQLQKLSPRGERRRLFMRRRRGLFG